MVIDIYYFIKININARWIKTKTISEFVFSFFFFYTIKLLRKSKNITLFKVLLNLLKYNILYYENFSGFINHQKGNNRK